MENEGFTSKKNTFVLPYADASLKLSGDFDSGNLYSAALDLEKQVKFNQIRNYVLLSVKTNKSSLVRRHGSISRYKRQSQFRA